MMYSYTFSKDDTDKITQKTNDYSSMLDDFKKVDDKYNLSADKVTFEKQTFSRPSDEEIETSAKNSLEDYKQTSLQNIEDDYKQKNDDLSSQIDELNSSAKSQKEETKNMYQTLKKDASNDATKRGLARSSIVINILDAFDQNMIDEINKINEEISTKVESLNNQKSLLSEQRQNALNAFDISYAVELSTKIDEINEKLAEEEQKVIEYNNQIAEKEAEYESKRNQDTLDRAEFIEKYGEDAIQNLKQDEKFEIALNYLNKLSKSEALSELETNRTYSYELGPTNYNRLKILINQRSE